MFCCENPYPIACKLSCECILLDIPAEQDGDYIFQYSYGTPKTVHTQTLTNVLIGQNLYIPYKVNADSSFILRIVQPDGSYLNFAPYDCFSVTVIPSLNHGFSEYGAGCNLDAVDLNDQAQSTETTTIAQVLSESSDIYRTIQIAPILHDGQPASRYWVLIGGLGIAVDGDGKFTVNLPAGDYDVRIEPLSDLCIFAPFTVSITLI